LQLPIRPNYSD